MCFSFPFLFLSLFFFFLWLLLPLFLFFLTAWRVRSLVSQCIKCSPFPRVQTELYTTVSVLHPGLLLRTSLDVCLIHTHTHTHTFCLLGGVMEIQAIALLPQIVYSCSEQRVLALTSKSVFQSGGEFSLVTANLWDFQKTGYCWSMVSL